MTAATDPFIEHSLRTSMFFGESRLFISGNPKAAGTSLRWWLLETHGVDVAERTARSLWGESAPYQTVWDGRVDLDFTWNDLVEEEQAEALTATDVLTVQPVRNPVTRCFSAWAGKFLTLEPYYQERLPDGFDEPPTTIDSGEQITELFDGFVRSLDTYVADDPEWSRMDVHFWPQHRLLAREPVGPVLLLRQEQMGDGLDAIIGHLKERGVSASPMPRMNENVVPYRPEFVSANALELIQQLYANDFSTYDYSAEPPSAGKQELDLPWLNDLRGRNRRYGVVHRAAMRARRRVGELTDELELARREIKTSKTREEELRESSSWRVTEPLRWASDRVSSARPSKKRD